MFVALTIAAGCVTQSPNGKDSEPQETTADEAADVTTVPDVQADPVPDACEILLTRLEETQPLLSNLDDTLAGQIERMEKAVERVNQPQPAPTIEECPTDSRGPLGRKEIIGSIEWLFMDPPGRHYRARVDSGAETSSLSAHDVVEFERDGDDWVRFTFDHGGTDEPVELELPVKRAVLIHTESSEEAERRVVVELDVRLGDQLQTTEFSLSDRGGMTYPMSLGRAFLMDLYVVDVARSYTHARFETP